MKSLYYRLRLMVTAFGSGIILTGTVALWGTIPTPYAIMFLLALTFGLYSCFRFAISPTKMSNT